MGPIALARPAVDTTEEKRQGAVMLAIDTSESMRKTDLAPDRLAAAREAANRFLDEAPDESLVGLVSFNDRAVVQVAPTLDRVAVRSALDRQEIREGTALGSAVVASLGSLAGAGVLEATAQSSDTVLSEGAAGVDRDVDRPGHRVRAEAGVDRPGGETQPIVRVHHQTVAGATIPPLSLR
jgi:Mg-chelatase subunit ChlD